MRSHLFDAIAIANCDRRLSRRIWSRLMPRYRDVLKLLSKTELILGVVTAGLPIKQAEKLVRMKLHHYLNSGAIFI